MTVDLAATFAPPTVPLRDWLRERSAISALVDTDGAGHKMVYAGGRPRGLAESATAITVRSAGGLDGGTGHDRPFVQLDCWGPTGPAAEALAYAAKGVLDHARHAVLGLAAAPSSVRLVSAECPPPIFSPDPDDDTPRYVLTSTLTVKAVST